jgi:hypothetical protein
MRPATKQARLVLPGDSNAGNGPCSGPANADTRRAWMAIVAPGPRAIRRGASRYGVRGVAGFDSGSPVFPTMTTEMTAGSVALAFADVL